MKKFFAFIFCVLGTIGQVWAGDSQDGSGILFIRFNWPVVGGWPSDVGLTEVNIGANKIANHCYTDGSDLVLPGWINVVQQNVPITDGMNLYWRASTQVNAFDQYTFAEYVGTARFVQIGFGWYWVIYFDSRVIEIGPLT